MSNILEQVLRTNIYIQPFYFILTITANLINIRVLCSRTLRSSPCTHYFLGYAIFSIIYTCLLCPTQFLRGFSIFWANSRIGCEVHFYILFLIPFQANLMLVFASFDRFCSSSQSHGLHSRSTIRTARINIVVGTLLCIIYVLPMLIIYNWNEMSKKCLPKTNILISIYIFTQVFLYYILAPLLLFIFGVLTINNIRQQSARAVPLTTSIRGRRTERQLARMLILQVSVHLILILPFGITYSMNSFKLSTQTPTVMAVRLAFVTWQQCDYFVSFFLYIVSGSVYRQELVRLLSFTREQNSTARSSSINRKDVYREMLLITTTVQNGNEIVAGVPV